MRFPKRGFRNYTKTVYDCVNVDTLEARFPPEAVVTLERLREMRLIKGRKGRLKILGRGELTKPMTVRAHRFTREARCKIEQAGGQAEAL
jgi:large subunit ribosomal protein L15